MTLSGRPSVIVFMALTTCTPPHTIKFFGTRRFQMIFTDRKSTFTRQNRWGGKWGAHVELEMGEIRSQDVGNAPTLGWVSGGAEEWSERGVGASR